MLPANVNSLPRKLQGSLESQTARESVEVRGGRWKAGGARLKHPLRERWEEGGEGEGRRLGMQPHDDIWVPLHPAGPHSKRDPLGTGCPRGAGMSLCGSAPGHLNWELLVDVVSWPHSTCPARG